MELRSFNVKRIYAECVICRIGTDLGVRQDALKNNREDITDMVNQLEFYPDVMDCQGFKPLPMCNKRADGETWTPYLQIVEMLILLGVKIGILKLEGEDFPNGITVIKL